MKREHPSWGARKIRERLLRRFSGIPIPAKSTIHAVLDRHGLVERRGRLRRRAQGTPLSLGQRPNELWCTDYKGEFLLGNHQYCYPLTVTDHASRFLLTCEALSSTREDYAFTVFERLFKERGLPANIRSDNGVPFASAHALFNLSKLAVWWLRLGIGIERIKPGHPQQNGRHERMHLTLKKEATKPAAGNFLQQQARFDKFIEVFNNERPHEALDMKCPAEVYQPSPRPYTGLPDIDYPLHDKTIVVTRCGRICLGNKKINFSQVFAGQAVGIKEVHDDIWLVSFISGIGRSVGKDQVQLKLFLARRAIRCRRIALDEGEIFLFAHGKVCFDRLNLRNRGEHDLRAYKIPHLAGGDSGNAIDQRTNIGELQIQFGLFQCSFIGLNGRFGG